VNPKAVAGEEIGHLGYGQRDAAALHMHVDLGANQIKGWSISKRYCRGSEKKKCRQQNPGTEGKAATHNFYCTDAGL
jgi:hypothetical protein